MNSKIGAKNLQVLIDKSYNFECGWRSRGYLPHFDQENVTQFLTIRLYDSLPQVIIHSITDSSRINSKNESKLKPSIMHNLLDRNYGQCFLKNPEVANIVQSSLLLFDGIRYELYDWVVMHNHLHILLKIINGFKLSFVIRHFKSSTAYQANKILGRTGNFWYKDYFDRFIRNEDHFNRVQNYIDNNPVKAGLCKEPSQWQFGSLWYRSSSALKVRAP